MRDVVARFVPLVVVLVFASGVGRSPDVTPTHTITGLPSEQVAVVEWALLRFAEAGLPLPAIDFRGHETTDGCRGRLGYHVFEDGRSTIDLCGTHRRKFAEALYLHEIAHAWDYASLTDHRRRAFLELRGLTEWSSDELERWDELGAEHAAEITMWGLRDRPTQVIQIPDASCQQLLAGYIALTGQLPLNGVSGEC